MGAALKVAVAPEMEHLETGTLAAMMVDSMDKESMVGMPAGGQTEVTANSGEGKSHAAHSQHSQYHNRSHYQMSLDHHLDTYRLLRAHLGMC